MIDVARVALTERQREVLEFVRERIVADQRPPTVREICRHFGWRSSNGAVCHLIALERKGYIHRDTLVCRGIRLADAKQAGQLTLPIVGRVDAGALREAVQVGGVLDFTSVFGPVSELAAMVVASVSDRARMLREGDWLIVRGSTPVGVVRRIG